MFTAKKRGRKPKPHVTAWNETINGLRRRPVDGKWQLADGRVFTEPDEKKAVQRFRRMTNTLMEGEVGVNGVKVRFSPQDAERVAEQMGLTADQVIDLWTGDEGRFWARVTREISERPKFVAQMTGDERLG